MLSHLDGGISRTCDSLLKSVEDCDGIQQASLIKATLLRKYISTTIQVYYYINLIFIVYYINCIIYIYYF